VFRSFQCFEVWRKAQVNAKAQEAQGYKFIHHSKLAPFSLRCVPLTPAFWFALLFSQSNEGGQSIEMQDLSPEKSEEHERKSLKKSSRFALTLKDID
jgi:hypothetical protein